MQIEIWKDVVGYEGFYQVSDLGNVRSLARMVKASNGKGLRKSPGKILIQCIRGGYKNCSLCKYGKIVNKAVHLMVLEAFIGPPPIGMQACHGKNGRFDNTLSNVSWGSISKNNKEDKLRDGTLAFGEKVGTSILTKELVLKIKKLLKEGIRQYSILKEIGFPIDGRHRMLIYRISSGKTWARVN